MHRIQGLPSLLLLSSACWVLLSKFYIRGTNWDKEEQKSFHHCVNMNPASMSNVFRGSLPSQCTQGHLSIVNHIWHKHCLTSWLTSDHLHFFFLWPLFQTPLPWLPAVPNGWLHSSNTCWSLNCYHGSVSIMWWDWIIPKQNPLHFFFQVDCWKSLPQIGLPQPSVRI